MVNFGLLAAEICWRVWGTPANFNGFRVSAAFYARHYSSVRLAGRPSRWALAHILVTLVNPLTLSITLVSQIPISDL